MLVKSFVLKLHHLCKRSKYIMNAILLLVLIACSETTMISTSVSSTAINAVDPTSTNLPGKITIPPPTATRNILSTQISPSSTSLPVTLTAEPLALPSPLPGWTVYENKADGYALTYPINWEQKWSGAQNPTPVFQSTETFSQISVEIKSYPTKLDSNATWRGLPAQIRLDEGGGSAQITLTIIDGKRTITLRFHSGVLPRLKAEMQVFRQVMDTLILKSANGEGEMVDIPVGWEHGSSLVRWIPALEPATIRPERQEIVGTVIKSDPFDFQITAESGQHIQLEMNSGYQFQGLPVEFFNIRHVNIVENERIHVIGYVLASGLFKPEYVEIEQDGIWQPQFFKTFFDLMQEELDPTLLSHYPQGKPIQLSLYGTVAQTLPYLVNIEGESLAGSDFSVNQTQKVLAQGILQRSDGSLHLTLKELYVLDGKCTMVSEIKEDCSYWQPVYPVTAPINITASVLETHSETNVIVLERPGQGIITITLAEDGLLLKDGKLATWAELTQGTQVQATGTVGPAGTLLTQEIILLATEE